MECFIIYFQGCVYLENNSNMYTRIHLGYNNSYNLCFLQSKYGVVYIQVSIFIVQRKGNSYLYYMDDMT
ncbi:hypothetical protein V1478_006491 [Vespula squamosa]|uniref:Uncharacterized protein n=1 Tax=Vespula squamosa TaxID=30214 RepID=A0ABD2B801_VESSQ